MKCPNCTKVNVINNVCPTCGVDAVLFQQTSIISCNLYNKGLAQAKLRDMSGAMALLNKSIEFNKNNIMARNLLGLVYFEVGYIGDALRHWVISSSQIRENNDAAGYIDRLQKNSRQLEQLSDAVKMYNNALDYLRQKADDMAIIQLRKALEINPVFIDALNLLSFCYLIQKDKVSAAALVEKVLALDINNAVALRYYQELYPAKIRPEPKKITKLQAGAPLQSSKSGDPRSKRLFGESFHLTEILSFLIGLIVAFALLYILVMPGAVAASRSELASLRQSLNEIETQFQIESEESANQIADQAERIRHLETENQSLSTQAQLRGRVDVIVSAGAHRDAGEVGEAALLLGSLGDDLGDLPDDARNTAESLMMEVYPLASRQFWEEGVTEYNLGNFTEALQLLDLSIRFGAPNLNFYDSVLFYRGSIAEHRNDTQLAIQYYQRIVTEYRGSAYLQEAQNRFRNLN
ncbi:MAG: hypothetical protein FWE20_06160 [Defluviitaleaceae bacterium]|nr:hypothetical protein [Defluviitaleaceae bacterium]